jgi:hypothetical protein
MPAYFFRSEPGAAELRRMAGRESGRVCQRVLMIANSHWLANSVFRSLADIMDACEVAWNRFATNTGLVRSLCAVAWAPASSAP